MSLPDSDSGQAKPPDETPQKAQINFYIKNKPGAWELRWEGAN